MSTDSESSSSSATNQTDNRRVIGQGGISAESSNVSVTNYSLDADVANHVVASGHQDLVSSLDFAAVAGNNAFGFASAAGSSAFNFASDAEGKAFGFAAKANAQALDSLNTTSNLVKDAYADAKGRGALTDKIMIGTIAGAVLIALVALQQGKHA